MKRLALLLVVLILGVAPASAEPGESYAGLSGAMLLPQGGTRHRPAGGATARVGIYLTENTSVEGEAGALEDVCLLAAQGLVHFSGCEAYDRFFGYSQFDPFLTGGVRGWIGRADGQVGPSLGLGAYYHLTESWSLRGDANVQLGLDAAVEVNYLVSVGICHSF